MKFSDLVTQARVLLKAKGRVSCRMLGREFALDEETLHDLKLELVETDRLATEEGEILVWAGETEPPAVLPSPSRWLCQNSPQKFTQALWIEDSEVL